MPATLHLPGRRSGIPRTRTRPDPLLLSGRWIAKLRDRLAIGLAAVSLVLALGTLMFGRYDPGVRLAASNGRVFITAVNERSIAREAGLAPGMVVTQLNNVTLVRFPQYVYPEPLSSSRARTRRPARCHSRSRSVWSPPSRPMSRSPATNWLPSWPPRSSTSRRSSHGTCRAGTVANGWNQASIFDDGRSGVRDAMPSVFLGAAILFIAGWWLASGRAGAGLQPLAVPLAVATAVPFILRPLEATWSPPLIAIGGVLLALAMVPLAIGLHDRIGDAHGATARCPGDRRLCGRRDRRGYRTGASRSRGRARASRAGHSSGRSR